MKQIERLSDIKKLLLEKEFITIDELIEMFKKSDSTIRRDLEILKKQEIITIDCGIITLNRQVNQNSMNFFSSREISNIPMKNIIAQKAANLIEDGDTLFLDSSTTVLELAKCITPHNNVTYITNDLLIALKLEERRFSNIILIGGTISNGSHALVGSISHKNLEGLYISKVFLGAGGILKSGYITNYNLEAIELRKKVISISKKIIILADSTKFGKDAMAPVVSLNEIDFLITNKVPDEFANLFKKNNYTIIQVGY